MKSKIEMTNYRHYTYRVTWSDEDQEYIALYAEFPSISYLAETHQEALEGILDLVKCIVEDMNLNNFKREIPSLAIL